MGLTSIEELETELQEDTKVKVAGIDADGVLRGKIMAKDKFLSAAKSGFGFCRLGSNVANRTALSLVGTSMIRYFARLNS